jgi:hypothetical protein
VPGNATRPGGHAHTSCSGEHNSAGKQSKLRLDGGRDVRKPSRTSAVHGTEIVGQIEEERSAMSYAHPNSGIRAIDGSRGAAPSRYRIFRLRAAGRDDDTGVVTSGRSVWISLWLSGQYSAAEAPTISRPSATN